MSRDVSPTMTNTNTTPNDTDRTTERTRSTPRAPARALPRRALPPRAPAPARPSLSIHDRPVPSFFYRRVTARAPHRSVSIESTRQSATRAFAFASTSRLARLHLHGIDRLRDTFSMVVSGGIHIRVYEWEILRLHYVPCVRVHASRPRVPSRPTDRPPARALTWRLGRMRMTRSIAHTSTRGRSRGNSTRKHCSRRSCDGRSRRDIERVVRAHAFIHSFIHSFRGWIKR